MPILDTLGTKSFVPPKILACASIEGGYHLSLWHTSLRATLDRLVITPPLLCCAACFAAR